MSTILVFYRDNVGFGSPNRFGQVDLLGMSISQAEGISLPVQGSRNYVGKHSTCANVLGIHNMWEFTKDGFKDNDLWQRNRKGFDKNVRNSVLNSYLRK